MAQVCRPKRGHLADFSGFFKASPSARLARKLLFQPTVPLGVWGGPAPRLEVSEPRSHFCQGPFAESARDSADSFSTPSVSPLSPAAASASSIAGTAAAP